MCERGLSLEMHAREVDEEVRVARQQALDTGWRTFARVSEDHHGLAVGRQRAVECRRRVVGQLVVDDHGRPELRRDVEHAAECRVVGIPVDLAAPDLTDVDLAEHRRLGPR